MLEMRTALAVTSHEKDTYQQQIQLMRTGALPFVCAPPGWDDLMVTVELAAYREYYQVEHQTHMVVVGPCGTWVVEVEVNVVNIIRTLADTCTLNIQEARDVCRTRARYVQQHLLLLQPYDCASVTQFLAGTVDALNADMQNRQRQFGRMRTLIEPWASIHFYPHANPGEQYSLQPSDFACPRTSGAYFYKHHTKNSMV